MTTNRTTRGAIISSILALILCFAMLLGSTFAWFTDSASSSGNKIVSGTLDVDFELLDKDTGVWNSLKGTNAPIFNYDKWEPGYTEVKILKVENLGTLALKWKAVFTSEKNLSALADVIDVYVLPYGVLDDAAAASLAYPADLTGYTCVGSLASYLNTIETSTYGNLEAGESAYLGIALQMKSDAGNEYQGLDLCGSFDLTIVAAQRMSESDSFGTSYDSEAPYFEISSTPVELPSVATGATTLSSGAENGVTVEIPAALVNNLPDEITKISLAHSAPKINVVEESVTFDSVEIIDQNGVAIDLSENTSPIAVTLAVPFADGTELNVYHDGKLVCVATVADGKISYEALHFCPVTLTKATPVEINSENAEEALAALIPGQTVVLTSDVTLSETLTLPANITLKGDAAINGTVIAGGDITFAGHIKVTTFSPGFVGNTVNIVEGGCLEITTTDRTTFGYGNTFNITGSITDAKNADKAAVKPSLIANGGVSVTGYNGVTFNVKNAYISLGSTTSKNSVATGVFNFNFENSIIEFTNQFTLAAPTNGKTPTFNITATDSVITTGTKFVVMAPDTNVVLDNSSLTTATYFRNSGNVILKNGSNLDGKTIQFGENGGHDGTMIVDNSTLKIVGGSAGNAFDGKGTGSITVQNNSEVSIDYYKDLTITADETSSFTGTEVNK